MIASTCDTTYIDYSWRYDSGYYYKVSAIDIHGNESDFALLGPDEITGDEEQKTPEASFLAQNYPNPFNPSTTIKFALSEASEVSLCIYDVSGRLVRTLLDRGKLEAGMYTEIWNGLEDSGEMAASGVYFYRLTARGFRKTRKMVLVR